MALAEGIWWTRKSRIQAEKRLLATAFQSQLLLFWYSLCSVAVSIYYLRFDPTSEYVTIAWLILSVLVFAVAGFIGSLKFKERAGLIKECYETLQVLHERLTSGSIGEDDAQQEYRKILAVCENHKEQDFIVALCDAYLQNTSPDKSAQTLDKTPNWYLWLMYAFYRSRAFFVYAALYLLPVILFLLAELRNGGV